VNLSGEVIGDGSGSGGRETRPRLSSGPLAGPRLRTGCEALLLTAHRGEAVVDLQHALGWPAWRRPGAAARARTIRCGSQPCRDWLLWLGQGAVKRVERCWKHGGGGRRGVLSDGRYDEDEHHAVPFHSLATVA